MTLSLLEKYLIELSSGSLDKIYHMDNINNLDKI